MLPVDASVIPVQFLSAEIIWTEVLLLIVGINEGFSVKVAGFVGDVSHAPALEWNSEAEWPFWP